VIEFLILFSVAFPLFAGLSLFTALDSDHAFVLFHHLSKLRLEIKPSAIAQLTVFDFFLTLVVVIPCCYGFLFDFSD